MTQGVVSVMKDGRVVLKIIAGSDGMKARAVYRDIRRLGRVPSLDEAYDIARNRGMGSCGLVVMDDNNVKSDFEGEPLSPLYRTTFQQPKFNPRWECGLADYVEVAKF